MRIIVHVLVQILTKSTEKLFQHILACITPPKGVDPKQNHLTARAIRQEGTGLWILESQEFEKWRDVQADAPRKERFLWVCGGSKFFLLLVNCRSLTACSWYWKDCSFVFHHRPSQSSYKLHLALLLLRFPKRRKYKDCQHLRFPLRPAFQGKVHCGIHTGSARRAVPTWIPTATI